MTFGQYTQEGKVPMAVAMENGHKEIVALLDELL